MESNKYDVYKSSEQSKFSYRCNLSVIEYIAIVQNLADGFWGNDNVTYEPHYGFLNALQIFYNQCVIDTPYKEELPDGITGLKDIDLVANDKDFIIAFNNAISGGIVQRIDFANAYNDAMKIVETRKTSVDRIIGEVDKKAKEILNKIVEIMESDEIKELEKKLKNSGNEKIDYKKMIELVADEYGKRQGFANRKQRRKKA